MKEIVQTLFTYTILWTIIGLYLNSVLIICIKKFNKFTSVVFMLLGFPILLVIVTIEGLKEIFEDEEIP